MDVGFGAQAPGPRTSSEAATIDFVVDSRRGVIALNTTFQQQARAALSAAISPGEPPAGIEQIRTIVNRLPGNTFRHALDRMTMETVWSASLATFEGREAAMLATLAAADKSGPGSIEYDEGFRHPEYYLRPQFHLQPGSFHGHPLAGYLFHLGTDVFFVGQNDGDAMHREVVSALPSPVEGKVLRVLDLACAIGQATTALKERFPDAEVWGIDASAPMLRYAHKRSREMGIDVHFAQRLAEESGFPDEHFDIVMAHLVFHELPANVTRRVVAEVHRMLRPGGVFAATDVRNRDQEGPDPAHIAYAEYMRHWWAEYNDDPYHVEFFDTDLEGLLRSQGFQQVTGQYPGVRPGWPMRVGLK